MQGYRKTLVWLALLALGLALGAVNVIRNDWHWAMGFIILPLGFLLMGTALQSAWKGYTTLQRRDRDRDRDRP